MSDDNPPRHAGCERANFALSAQQEVVWLHHQIAPTSAAYHFVTVSDIVGPLDTDALKRAIRLVAAHHPGMWLQVAVPDATTPMQRMADQQTIAIVESDLRSAPEPQRSLQAIWTDAADSPFDLTRAPLARWHLALLPGARHQLIHTEHHLIHDGRSFSMFLSDLFDTYAAIVSGTEPALEPSLPYERYVRHCATDAFRSKVAENLVWWRRELRGAGLGAQPLRGLARRTGSRRGYAGAQMRQELPVDLARRLRAQARRDGCTLFAVLFGLFSELLRRHDGGDETVVGTAVANRPAEFGRMIGMLVNSAPIRIRHAPDWSAGQLCRDAMDRLFEAMDRNPAPIQEIVRAVGASGSGLDNPLFRVMFSQHDSALPNAKLDGLDVTFVEGVNVSSSRVDLDVVVLQGRRAIGGENTDEVTLVWDYSTEFFDADTVCLLADRFTRLLRSYVEDPALPAGQLVMNSESDHVVTAVGPSPASTDGTGIVDRIWDHARANPDRPAVTCGSRTVDYAELVTMADTLADGLARAGVGRDHCVATVLPRGVDAVVALLACLRSGRAFTPLPWEAPDQALAAMTRRLGPGAVLSTSDRVAALRAADVLAGALADPVALAGGATGLNDAAYIIHTSGSTGQPKPVAVPLPALTATVNGLASTYALGPADRVLQFATPAFDVFLEEVLPTLLCSGHLVVPAAEIPTGDDLAALVLFRRITVVNLPTSYLIGIVDELRERLAGRENPLRLVVVGGERLLGDAATQIARLVPGGAVLNAYGVTESAITSVVYRVDPASDGAEVPLGRPLPGVSVRVVDRRRQALPAGVVGEIAIGGHGATGRYPCDHDQTAERFVRLDGPANDGLWYLTGDLGVFGTDGLLRFVGRADRQLKVLGHRIEPEEVEVHARHLLAAAVAVVAVERGGIAQYLAGFVEGTDEAVTDRLAQGLVRRLPRYAVPRRWTVVPALPRLNGGKVDYAALHTRAAAQEGESAAVSTTSSAVDSPSGLAGLVTRGFHSVLGRTDIGADDDFFAMGGHSLLVAQLVAWIDREAGVRPAIGDVFECPTPSGLARHLTQGAQPTSGTRDEGR